MGTSKHLFTFQKLQRWYEVDSQGSKHDTVSCYLYTQSQHKLRERTKKDTSVFL